MSTLTIRKLPDDVHARLRVRAATNGRSMEAEVRAILVSACSEEQTQRRLEAWQALKARTSAAYGASKPTHVVDDFIAERRAEAAKETDAA